MDTINDNLELTVVNDGNGSQCGASYATRCSVFGNAFHNPSTKAAEALNWVVAANRWMISRGYEGVSCDELLDQARKVAAYYTQHAQEQ